MALNQKKTKEQIILELVISINQSGRNLNADQIVAMAEEEYKIMETVAKRKRYMSSCPPV